MKATEMLNQQTIETIVTISPSLQDGALQDMLNLALPTLEKMRPQLNRLPNGLADATVALFVVAEYRKFVFGEILSGAIKSESVINATVDRSTRELSEAYQNALNTFDGADLNLLAEFDIATLPYESAIGDALMYVGTQGEVSNKESDNV